MIKSSLITLSLSLRKKCRDSTSWFNNKPYCDSLNTLKYCNLVIYKKILTKMFELIYFMIICKSVPPSHTSPLSTTKNCNNLMDVMEMCAIDN